MMGESLLFEKPFPSDSDGVILVEKFLLDKLIFGLIA